MFSKVLKSLRDEKRITQQELSKKLHIALSTVGTWESKDVIPPADKLILLADFFDVSIDFLLGREEKKEVTITASNIIAHSPKATMIVNNGEQKTRELTEIELEILKVCENLTFKEKAQILNFAYEIEKQKENKSE